MIKEGEALTPNFWRAPTDNDFGAGLQKKYAAWKNPEMKLTSLNQRMENKQVIVEAVYDMPTVSAKLNLTYVINNKGAIKVTQKMTADKNAKVSPMFRFGMQMPMPRYFENIEYYGRGPVENYIDRKGNADLAIYRQTVDEQLYPSAREWNEIGYPLVENAERGWQRYRGRSLCPILRFRFALYDRVFGRRCPKGSKTLSRSRGSRLDKPLSR